MNSFLPLLGLPTAFLGASSEGSCLNPSFWMPSFDFSVQWRCGGFVVTGLSGHPSLSFLACCPPGHLPAHHFGLNILGGQGGNATLLKIHAPLGAFIMPTR